jgi:HTH-type transcriptional regulator, competence development regulator
VGNKEDMLAGMRPLPKLPAPAGFIKMLREGMELRKISLNQLAEKAGVSPAYLSRILNKERGLPSDKAILRLAEVLDLQPRERLLIEAGRVPADLKPFLSQPRVPALLRAVGKLSETEQKEVLKMVEALALKHHRRQGK